MFLSKNNWDAFWNGGSADFMFLKLTIYGVCCMYVSTSFAQELHVHTMSYTNYQRASERVADEYSLLTCIKGGLLEGV